MSWTVSPCFFFLTLEDSWITRINPISTVVNRILSRSYFLTPALEPVDFRKCPISLSSEWQTSCLSLNASSVKFVVDFRCRVVDCRMGALSWMCLLIYFLWFAFLVQWVISKKWWLHRIQSMFKDNSGKSQETSPLDKTRGDQIYVCIFLVTLWTS